MYIMESIKKLKLNIVCLPAEPVATSMLYASGLVYTGGGGGLSIKQFGQILRLIFGVFFGSFCRFFLVRTVS